ncbi:ATPase, AFG1 family protein [Oceanicola granulosus HTCC2516]|uniref:ATPase, AFG1 family protein n=1 Tax=Oceanicola granulosus (strain ATCC BAA-861 / DSM 15982 / KCTC 12143 / HTCC2516) TaxID=314256 RepID=Q2CD51_OCEGH|nr:cell division protein ZapE [Oceanicola granulosus]EAR50627.1 ATPase, AFG1 family protein [Oceanicola granulosus HTCC2516]
MSIHDRYAARVAEGSITADPDQQGVLDELERVRTAMAEAPPPPGKARGFFRKAAPAPEPATGLYLWGGVGVGKSMLMDLLYEAVDAPKERHHFHAFMQQVHAGMNAARARGVDDAIRPVAEDIAGRLRFLAFDEMQITDIADAMIVGRLFERLFEGGVTVVTTSNRVPDDLYKDGLNRQLFLPFIELLKTRMKVVELGGSDHRQGRLKGAETYFTPDNAASRAALEDVWQSLTGGEGDPLVLRVQGRDVTIPGFHNGVARARFYDLCGRPLGPADYLALAEAARVLILSDIPRLGRHNFNEAKRFVTLIDALYEAKVRLFCSAAAEPEYLYVEGAGAFEFERTTSRLREMQADGWGAG